MKTQKIQITILILFASFMFFNGFKAEKFDIKTVSIDLQTNMICSASKKIIKNAVNKIDGVIEVEIETSDKIAIVKYDDSKTSVFEIESAITKAGFDANDKKADSDAYEKLSECCKTK